MRIFWDVVRVITLIAKLWSKRQQSIPLRKNDPRQISQLLIRVAKFWHMMLET